jgi:hypothetical protein
MVENKAGAPAALDEEEEAPAAVEADMIPWYYRHNFVVVSVVVPVVWWG